MLASPVLRSQAAENSKAQFLSSREMNPEILEAAINTMEGAMGRAENHELMGAQVLNSKRVRDGLLNLLLNNFDLYNELRAVVAAEE